MNLPQDMLAGLFHVKYPCWALNLDKVETDETSVQIKYNFFVKIYGVSKDECDTWNKHSCWTLLTNSE